MTYYKTERWRDFSITPIEVEKTSDHFLWINGSRYKIRTDYDNYFPTYQEAKDYYLNRERETIAGLEKRLAFAKEQLKKAEAL